MFRNPRENALREQSSPLQPSVGRPPSPPATPTATAPRTSAPASTAYQPAMAKVQTLAEAATTSPPARPSPRQTPARKGKAAPKANSSILSFFKKQDPDSGGPAELESLFIEDKRYSNGNVAQAGVHIGDEARDDEQDNEAARFNESNGSVKRRKRSPSPTCLANPNANGFEKAQAQACTPPPADFDDERNPENPLENGQASSGLPTKPTRRGPFVDESDSEDEAVRTTTSTEEDQNGDQSTGTHTSPTETDSTPDNINEEENKDPGIPTLHRQSTSVPEQAGFDDFEGIEDDLDDEYDEGEEFVERKYMEEQRRLEAEAGGGFEGDYASMKTEGEEPSLAIETASIPSCPICEASFAGVSDQEASVHVNHCLDGNPTPLPNNSTSQQAKQGLAPEDTPVPVKYERPVRAPKPGQKNPFELGNANGTSSAFSKMMSGNAEDMAWATAAAAENASRGKPAYTRTCPFYKILPGLFICVDAFRYGAVQGCNAYFLSHFHSDHYIGLTATWRHGPIYCSRPTANLVKQQLRVDPKYVVALEFEKKVEVPGTNGVYVTMIPANHCPGSSLYLFEKTIGKGANPKVQRILHCGDFRACPAHVEHPLLKPEVCDAISGKTAQQRIDVCYLDTTYLNPKYAFPSQEDVIQACADMCVSLSKTKADKGDAWEMAKRERAGGTMAKFVRQDSAADDKENEQNGGKDNPSAAKARGNLLVVVGTYSIGKERICLGIARALKSKIYAPPGKQRICAALEDEELNSRLTSDPRDAQVHMTPLFEIRADTLEEYLAEYKDRFSRAVGFRPSGWNYRPPGSRFTESPSVNTVLYSDNWKSAYTMKELVPQRGSTSRASTFGVPYSEHSSFRELTMFCCALRIDKIIPTVNIGSAKSRERMKLWCERWSLERKKTGFFTPGIKEEGYRAWFPGKGTMELRTNL